MLILLLGDSHGSPFAIEQAYKTALEVGCKKIVSLGDYGYWEHRYGGPEFLDLTSDGFRQTGIPFYWLDGNHEAHSWLRMTSEQIAQIKANYKKQFGVDPDTISRVDQLVPASSYRENLNPEGFWTIRPGLFYAPRGHAFVWDNVSFMTMGGAYSIDRGSRKLNDSWWLEEEITDEEIDAGIAKGQIDVLLSHDVPDGADITWQMHRIGKRFALIKDAEAGRQKLRRLVDSIRPSHIFHGHYHIRYTSRADFGYGPVKIVGLDCEYNEPDNMYILDTREIIPVEM